MSAATGMPAPLVAPARAVSNPSGVHAWRVLAPWWHWEDRAEDGSLRPSDRPALQMYDQPTFVQHLLATPQLRLAFDGRHDADVLPADGRDYLKLFQTTHQRFYLVVCGVHCDVAGLPSITNDQVCEAGFVIRRLHAAPTADERDLGLRLRRTTRLAEAKYAEATRRAVAASRAGDARTRAGMIRTATAVTRQRAAERVANGFRGDLDAWAAASATTRATEGWIPARVSRPDGSPGAEPLEVPGRGSWRPVAEEPTDLGSAGATGTSAERFHPLLPLFADPSDPAHDGRGQALYFGLVPTGSADLDDHGAPRLDDHSLYEIRCFVRRHPSHCPRHADGHDCHGPLTWSEPSDPFLLAGPLDLVGTSHRRVAVPLPDLARLKRQAGRLDPRDLGGLGLAKPKGWKNVDVDPDAQKASAGSESDGEICFMALPLITIVAVFVLSLFLPIVVFVMQLWWLLALRLCIPPKLAASAGAGALLDALGPEADAQVDLDLHAAAAAALLTDAAKEFGKPNGSALFDLAKGPTGGLGTTLASFAKRALASDGGLQPRAPVYAPFRSRSKVLGDGR